MDIKELKAQAYDAIAVYEQARKELTRINGLIAEASNGNGKAVVEPPKGEPETKE